MVSVLYVDDERDLLELAKMFLEQSPEFHVDILESAPDALKSSRLPLYDVIISDYQMPEMDGIGFLKEVRAKYGSIPFILFTGRGREEVVIDAINNGADFYLQKGGDVTAQFAELSHKIRQAVRRRQAEIQRVESEKRLGDIIDFLPDATFAIDRTGTIIAWNRAIEDMTGRMASEMLGRDNFEYAIPLFGTRRPDLIDLVFTPDEEIARFYRNLSREGRAITAETDLPRPGGAQITVIAKATPLYNRQGELTGAIESIRDITERNRAQDRLKAAYEQITASEEELREQIDALTTTEQKVRESAARLRYMLGFYEHAGGDEKVLMDYAVEGAGVVTGSPLGYLAFLNDDESELSMYAWSKSAMEECRLIDKPIIYRTEKTGLWGEAVRQRRPVITNDYAAPSPAKKGYPEGHPVILRHMNIPVIDDGKIVIVAGVANKNEDYTDDDVRQLSVLMHGLWQVIKQRKTREALLASEEKYRDLFENSVVGIFRTTTEGKFAAINTTFARIAGYDSPRQMLEEIRDIRTQLYVDPNDRDRFVQALVTEGSVKNFTARYYHRDGHPVWILINARTIRDGSGGIRYYEGTIEDITEQKKTEDALAREKTFSDAVIDSIPGLLYMYDSGGKLVRWNKAHETITGYSPEELAGRDVLSWFRGDDEATSAISAGLAQAFREGRAVAEAPILTRDGRKIPFYFTAQRLEIDGKTYITGVGIDITDRVKAQDELRAAYEQITASEEELREQLEILSKSEMKLRESETRFRAIFEKSHDALVISDEKILLDCNAKTLEMFGYSSVEEMRMLSSSDASPEFQPDGQDSRTAALVHLRTVFENGEDRFEWIHKRKDGATFPAEVFISTFELEGKTYFQTSVRDISGRKAAESAVKESEEKYRNIVETSPDLIWEIDTRGFFSFLSPNAHEVLGYRADDLLGRSIFTLVPQEMTAGTTSIFENLAKENSRLATFEVTARHADGHLMDLEIRSVPVLDDEGRLKGFRGIIRDITEQKRTEKRIRESENRYRSLVDITETGYLVLDDRGLVIDANDVYVRLTGRASLDELVGRPVTDWTAPHDLERNAREVEKCMKTGNVRGLEMDYIRPDGSIQPIEINATVFHGDRGDVILTLCRDISDRRRTSVALQQARNKLSLLNAVTFQDIQTAAFSLSAYQELIKAGLSDSKSKAYVEKQEIFLKKMVDTLEFARNYQEMGIHPPRWQNVRQVFLYAISHLDFLKMHQDVRIGNLEIFADPLFEKALFKIMENVLNHSQRATEVRLSYTKEGENLLLIIEDNGIGIPREEKNMIFDRGYGKGTGLGLFLVREVLSITGMSIRETGTPGQGTRFEISVPKGAYQISGPDPAP